MRAVSLAEGTTWAQPLPLSEGVVEVALCAALAECTGAAFVFASDGIVYRANGANRGGQVGDAKELCLALDESGPWPRVVGLGRGVAYAVHSLGELDGRAYYLAVERPSPSDLDERVAIAADKWQLSRRQTDALRFLVLGLSNRQIAQQLGIAVGTVEIHVGKVLRQADCESRAALAVRFWSTVIE